jgi:predicted ArsR family transcriptional regulator
MVDNPKYVPDSLSYKDKVKQRKSIREGTDRPKVNYKTKRSSHVKKFEERYGKKITDLEFIYKNIISKTGVDKILEKGMAAYYSSGSRPNVTKEQWSYARLASVITGGAARQVDRAIWEKYKIKK